MQEICVWFVILTGVYDWILGVGVIVAAPRNDAAGKAVWANMLVLGGFLIFAGAILVWAAQDLALRGPAVAWQGLLRLVATGVIFYAIKKQYYPVASVSMNRIAGIIDFVIGVVYFVILLGVWHWPLITLLLGGTLPAAALAGG